MIPRNLFRSKERDNYSLYLLLAGTVLLSSCSDPKLDEETNAGFDVTVSKSVMNIGDQPRCFFNDGRPDASAYVYCGNPAVADNCNGKPGPQQKIKLSQNENLDYVATVNISRSGNYSIAIVCGVGENQDNPIDSLKFLRHESYVVTIKDTAGLIASYNKPINHLKHSPASSNNFGLVCDDCHTVNSSNTFLYTTIDHSVLIEACSDCHSTTGIGAAPSSGHIVYTPLDKSCSDCHIDYMWLRIPPVDHDSLQNSCDNSSCHAFQKLPSTTHDATTAGCETCHIITGWTFIQ